MIAPSPRPIEPDAAKARRKSRQLREGHQPDPKFGAQSTGFNYQVPSLSNYPDTYPAACLIVLCRFCGCLYPAMSQSDEEYYDAPLCPARVLG